MKFWERPYYWELVGYHPPMQRKAVHVAWWMGSRVLNIMEFIGAIVADMAGGYLLNGERK